MDFKHPKRVENATLFFKKVVEKGNYNLLAENVHPDFGKTLF